MQPLDVRVVRVPGYSLSFDLPALPYFEPGMGSVIHEQEKITSDACSEEYHDVEKISLIESKAPELVAVVYLLTRDNYDKLIISEGGDSSYKQIEVQTFPIDGKDSSPITGWMLQGKRPRWNPTPLPSKRYVGLIKSGAAQHNFPDQYLDWLNSVEYFEIKPLDIRKQAGRIVFGSIWIPPVVCVISLQKVFGRNKLIKRISRSIFGAMWYSHDKFFCKVFGSGDVN